MKTKTVQDIDNWFNSEVKEAISEIPVRVIETAKGNEDYIKIIAASIARKKGFKVKAVLDYLKTNIYTQ